MFFPNTFVQFQKKIEDLQSQMENRTFQQVQSILEYNLRKDKQSYEVREILSIIGLYPASVNRIVSLLPLRIIFPPLLLLDFLNKERRQ